MLARIYEAAADSAAWRDCLSAIRGYVRAQSTILFTEDMVSKEVGLSVLEKADRKLIKEYYDHYIHKSPLLKAKMSAPFGAVLATNLMMSDQEWGRHEFYYDYLRRCERFYEMGALIRRDGTHVSVLSVIRAKRAGGYTREDTRKLAELVPHIARACEIGRRMGVMKAEHASLAALLDKLTMGVVLCNRSGRVVHVNRCAEGLFKAGDGLKLRNGELVADSAKEIATLRDLLQRCIATALGTGSHSGEGMTFTRRPPAAPLTALVTPLRSATPLAGAGADQVCAAVFLSEPQRPHTLLPEVLRELFGLTEAEAAIVRQLADGRSSQEVSQSLKVSWHTVRTQQRVIYDKLGVSTQSQLVKTVLSSPALLRH
jgi:DNA-binding CsgD family transcriptional regulator